MLDIALILIGIVLLVNGQFLIGLGFIIIALVI